MQAPKITVVAGTNRKNSLTSALAYYYSELLHKKGHDNQVLELTKLPADFIVSGLYENRGKNSDFNQLKGMMEVAGKYVFIIPEYNGSFPGVFKAFIDGLQPSIFKGKKGALVGVSKGVQGGMFALSHLTDIFHYLNMHVYPLKPRLANIQDSHIQTVLANEQYVQLLDEQAEGLVVF